MGCGFESHGAHGDGGTESRVAAVEAVRWAGPVYSTREICPEGDAAAGVSALVSPLTNRR